jgi:hypothetical protein
MEICWDNIENLVYKGNNVFCRPRTKHYFIIKDKCKGCGDEFITYRNDEAEYCSRRCARIHSNPMHIPKVRRHHREICRSEVHRKSISERQKGKKRPQQSKFMKKNNPMFDDNVRRKHNKVMSSTEYKKNMSKIIKKRWEDENYRHRYEQSIIKKGLKKPDFLLEEIERYRRKVKGYTKKSLIKYWDIINPEDYPIGIGEGFYNVDHIFSIVDGFNNNVSPKVIGSVVNLQVIQSKQNIIKNSDSWISKSELLMRYEEYENSI